MSFPRRAIDLYRSKRGSRPSSRLAASIRSISALTRSTSPSAGSGAADKSLAIHTPDPIDAITTEMTAKSERLRNIGHVACVTTLLPPAGREILEYLLHSLVEILDISGGFIRESIARRSAPDEFLRHRVEQIDDERSDSVGLRCRCCITEASAPAPASAESVVPGVERAAILGHFHGDNGNLATG